MKILKKTFVDNQRSVFVASSATGSVSTIDQANGLWFMKPTFIA